MGGSGRFGTACAFAVLVALAGCTADAPPPPVSAPTPSASASASASAEPSASPSGPPASLPDRYVAVVDADLVVDRVAGSAPRTLARYDAPPPAGYSGEPVSSLAGVELSPDGTTAYADVCCEPAAGSISAFPTDGSPPGELPAMSASSPALSPDGRSLFGFSLDSLVTKELGDPGRQSVRLTSFADRPGLRQEALAHGPDGRLAFLETPVGEQAEADGPSRLVVLRPREAPRSYDTSSGQT